MSESPKPPTFISAEKEFLIEPESGYFKAVRFAQDPVQYFLKFKQSLEVEGFDEMDWGIQAMAELAELEQVILNEDVLIRDERVSVLCETDYATEEWAQNIFSIFKEAGFTKEQLAVWFEVVSDELTPEEKFTERTMLFHLNTAFNT